MISIFDLKEMDCEELRSKIEITLSTFPILKSLYEKPFLDDLVEKRFHYDNHLLWLLVSGHPFAIVTWDTISKYLKLLEDSGALSHFKEKLRHRSERVFQSYMTELEMAGYYKEKGYEIELEPPISKSGKNPDFKAEWNEHRVFFEVKNLFIDELMQMDDINSQLHGRFGEIDSPFVFGFSYRPPALQMKHLKPLQTFVEEKFAELEKRENISFPLSFFFPDRKDPIVEVKVRRRPRKLDHGYLAGAVVGAFGLPGGGKNIRRKISRKMSQLPKEEANVIVVELGHLFYDELDVQDALFGNEALRVNLKDSSTQVVRGKDRIFDSRKNTRLSAVIYYKRKFLNENFLIHKKVYHNPFAARPIPQEFFEGKNVKQLIPIEEKEFYRMEWVES